MGLQLFYVLSFFPSSTGNDPEIANSAEPTAPERETSPSTCSPSSFSAPGFSRLVPYSDSSSGEEEEEVSIPESTPPRRNLGNVRCRDCQAVFTSWPDLYEHRREIHAMRGYGLNTQPFPYDTGEEPWLSNPDLQRLYDRYRHVILGHHQCQKVRHTFNIPNVTTTDLQNFFTTS